MISTYRLHIRPNSRWLHFDWHALWDYRDLLLIMIRRDFVAKYKQTLLGPAWFVIQPVITTLVFTVIFGGVAHIPTGNVPHPLFYLSGLLGWQYFATNFATTSSVLASNAYLFGKVYFPRLVPPLATIISNLFTVFVQIGTLLVFYLFYKYFTRVYSLGLTLWYVLVGRTPSSGSLALAMSEHLGKAADTFGMRWEIVFLPLIILQIAVLSLGVGLWMSALTVTYRDFSHLMGFLTQLWMYATPVVYPLTQIPQKWRWVSLLNPMTMPVESIKYVFLGVGFVHPVYVAVSASITVAATLSGIMVFQHVERTFIDTI